MGLFSKKRDPLMCPVCFTVGDWEGHCEQSGFPSRQCNWVICGVCESFGPLDRSGNIQTHPRGGFKFVKKRKYEQPED